MSEPPFQRIAIVGLGLMGGSLARALKARPAAPWVSAADPSAETLAGAREARVIDRACPLSSDAVIDCDLVVYAIPYHALLDTLERDRECWTAGAVITDVAGVKAPVLERMRGLGESGRYVGSHPMAGDHRSGFEASREGLYDGARVWLVGGDAGAEVRERVDVFWRWVGARPGWLGEEEHDELMAWASHLPQLVANAMAGALAARGIEVEHLGPGGRDMTRLAASPASLWAELLGANRERVASALEAVIGELEWLRSALERGDLRGLGERLERTRGWRESR